MTGDLLLAFTGFAFSSSITPGPNNTMLLASGANYGFRRTVPHIAGINLGFVAMFVLVAIGLGALFTALPQLYLVLRYAGALYLLWLAWKIARAGSVQPGRAGGRPLTLWQAAAFQWVNPKAWIIVVGAVTVYLPVHHAFGPDLAALALVLLAVSAPCTSVWAGGGTVLRPLLRHPWRVRAFNVGMAALLVLSLMPLVRA